MSAKKCGHDFQAGGNEGLNSSYPLKGSKVHPDGDTILESITLVRRQS
jgi:hypothetical protein